MYSFHLLDVLGKCRDKEIDDIIMSGQIFVSLTYLWHSYMHVFQLSSSYINRRDGELLAAY